MSDRHYDILPSKLRLYHAILNTAGEFLTENELQLGTLLAGDKDIQEILDKDKARETLKKVCDDIINRGKEAEILAEKGDQQILDVIKDAKEARTKKWDLPKEKGGNNG